MTTSSSDSPESRDFELLLEYLKYNRGFDFTGYKRSSLRRRIHKRLQQLQIMSYNDYMDYLEVHPEEFLRLFNTILINVTAFFRDTAAWDYLAQEILPEVMADKTARSTIRIWSAGCASGEEAYALAILLAEALGAEAFCERVKIYAADMDEEALAQARQAIYSPRDLQTVPELVRDKYFEPLGSRYVFRPDLRRAVIFGRHDLQQDAPISRLDLLTCRNTLMYFNAESQARILARWHFALNDRGFLFLGKAEMLLTHSTLFVPRSLKYRIFTKVPKLNLRDRLMVMAQSGETEASDRLSGYGRLRDIAFEVASLPQLVVDVQGNLVLANQRARSFFALSARDLGRHLSELAFSHHPVELRSYLVQLEVDLRNIHLTNVEWILPEEQVQYFDIQFAPLLNSAGTLLGTLISFKDVTRIWRLRNDLEKNRQELETAYEELQASNEELETTNEELQLAVEELETTNEELQSTNEELETINEELQSGNEELQTMNDELRLRTDDLNQANAFLESVLASLHAGAVVLDHNFNILMWNDESRTLWGWRSEEVQGRSLFSLDIGLPVEQLREPVLALLSGESSYEERVLEATSRSGRTIQCRVTCSPLHGAGHHIEGVILVMEEWHQSTIPEADQSG